MQMRFRPRYTIVGLLIAVLLAALMVGYYLNLKRLRDAEAELRKFARKPAI